MTGAPLQFRACEGDDDFRQCLELQMTVWGFAQVDLLPFRFFVVVRHVGGQIFGAFTSEGRMAGFLLAIPGLRHGQPYLHSHMLGVLPEFRDQGVGRKLKLMQRDDALARGVRLVEWTFDPLELKNAFFNIERLGAIVRRYLPNVYGATTSALQAGLPTDRLVAEWWVDAPHVERVIARKPARVERPDAFRLEVPADIAAVKQRNREQALEIQQRVRGQFEHAFAEGLVVTGFDRKGVYLFERAEAPAL